MKRPVWFRRDHALHWTPCTWQGWTVTGGFVALLAALVVRNAPTNPVAVVPATFVLVALLMVIVVNTDDTRSR